MTKSLNARAPLERAVKAILAAQKIKKAPAHQGGWRYNIAARDSDVSVSGWIIMALKSAKLAGLEIPSEVFDDAATFLWTVYDSQGGLGYNGPAQTPNMTGVGILCQQFLGHYSDPRLKPALDSLKNYKPEWDTGTWFPLYGTYYITQAMFQAGGAYWEYWNKQFQKPLLDRQASDGHCPPAEVPT